MTGPTGDVNSWIVTGFSWDDQEEGVPLVLVGAEVAVGVGRPTALAGRERGLPDVVAGAAKGPTAVGGGAGGDGG